MSLDPSANFAKSTLSTGYASGVTTIVLTTGGGAKFPAPSFNAVWYNSTDYSDPSDDPTVEIVRVTGVSTDTLTVTRGQESTGAANHNTAGKTYTLVAGPTAKLLADVLGISITGSAAKWTTARNLAGNSVDGSADATFANAFIVKGTADAGLSGAQFLGALGTGIVKNTTSTGVLSIAVAGDFPTLNQDTTGTAAKATILATTRTINGVDFNGAANITVTADANTLSGTTLKSTVVASSLTSVGTLASLLVTGKVGIGTAAPERKLDVSETVATNEQAVFRNAGTYHTGIGFTSTSALLTDTKAWGIYGGPNNYVSLLADRVAICLSASLADFAIVTGKTNLNTNNGTAVFKVTTAGAVTLGVAPPAFAAGDKYLVIDASGNIHKSAVGPAS